MRYLSESWEEVQALPHLRSWEDAVKGQAVRVDRNTIPPKQFVRDEDLLYTWKRLIYGPYSGRVYLDDRQTKATVDKVLLFGSPMERRGPTERYDPFETAVVERLNRIDEVFEKLVKPLNSEAPWHVYVFRVGDAWYSDYTTYRAGGEAQAFTTAQEAADALKERTRRFYKDPDEIKRKEEEKRLEAERVAEETRRQLAKAAALAERRRAEDEEITALEAQLADIERTRYLNELRAKVARAKENGDV